MKETLDRYERIFYDNDEWLKSRSKKKVGQKRLELLSEARKIAIDERVDELAPHKSALRKRTDMTVDQFLEEMKKTDWAIWRYVCCKEFLESLDMDDICQIFCRIDNSYKELDSDENGEFYWKRNRDLFLYVNLPYKEGVALLEKYGLTERT